MTDKEKVEEIRRTYRSKAYIVHPSHTEFLLSYIDELEKEIRFANMVIEKYAEAQ